MKVMKYVSKFLFVVILFLLVSMCFTSCPSEVSSTISKGTDDPVPPSLEPDVEDSKTKLIFDFTGGGWYSTSEASKEIDVVYGKTSNFDINATVPTKVPSYSNQAVKYYDGFYLEPYFKTQIVDKNNALCKNVDGYTNSVGEWISEETELTVYIHWNEEQSSSNGGWGASTAYTQVQLTLTYGLVSNAMLKITRGSTGIDLESPDAVDVKNYMSFSIDPNMVFDGFYLSNNFNPVEKLINADGSFCKNVYRFTDENGKWISSRSSLNSLQDHWIDK